MGVDASPSDLSEEQRFREIVSILAAGIVRMHRLHHYTRKLTEKSETKRPAGLDVSDKTVLGVRLG